MTRRSLRRALTGIVAAPLVLALAACGGQEVAETGGLSGEPIAAVAPPEGKTWAEVIEKTEAGGYRMGNPEAPIKLVELGSLTCSHCADFAEQSEPELRDTFVNSGRVSFEFRNFVRDPLDITAAQLSRCGAPGTYFALTNQAMANQAEMFETWAAAGEARLQQISQLPTNQRGLAIAETAGLLDFFAARGISRDQAAACLADTAATTELARQTETQAEQYDITGTPAFLINGQKADVANWAEVKARLETMGAR
jgi:protein-disulfide isomerase